MSATSLNIDFFNIQRSVIEGRKVPITEEFKIPVYYNFF